MATLHTTELARGQMDAYLAMALLALDKAEDVARQAAMGQTFPYQGHPLAEELRDHWVRVRAIRRDILDPDTDWTFKQSETIIKLAAHRIEEIQLEREGAVSIMSDEVEEILRPLIPRGMAIDRKWLM